MMNTGGQVSHFTYWIRAVPVCASRTRRSAQLGAFYKRTIYTCVGIDVFAYEVP